jgi:hypothetical protein
MNQRMNPDRERREAEAAKKKLREGAGAVPNALPVAHGETEELKKALHEFEEEKGDWSKGH